MWCNLYCWYLDFLKIYLVRNNIFLIWWWTWLTDNILTNNDIFIQQQSIPLMAWICVITEIWKSGKMAKQFKNFIEKSNTFFTVRKHYQKKFLMVFTMGTLFPSLVLNGIMTTLQLYSKVVMHYWKEILEDKLVMGALLTCTYFIIARMAGSFDYMTLVFYIISNLWRKMS